DVIKWARIGQDGLAGWPNQVGTAKDDCSVGQIWLVNSDPVSWFCFGALGAVSVPFLAIGGSPSMSTLDQDVDNVGGWHPTETCDCPARCLTSVFVLCISKADGDLQ
ncbi:hypothetical protein CMEL01_07057, partial [Colletotrichum melonis]